MRSETLRVEGAFTFTPVVYPDERGTFTSPYQETAFFKALGHNLFPVAQTNHTYSRLGVVRGVHFTATPPGCAKYVHCVHGRALDIVVDVRVGSPTFGQWDAVELDPAGLRAIYLPISLGHAVVALEEGTIMSYLVSASYVPANELTLSVLDPHLGLPIPAGMPITMSDRDRLAPTLAQTERAGLLPHYSACRELL